MKQKTRRRISTITRIITSVLIVILLLGVVGFFAYFTNNFTSRFKTFYVTVRGTTFMNETGSYELGVNEEYRFNVKYTLGALNKEKLGYHVKIVPNITDGTRFDFTVDGAQYGYEGESVLTSGFVIEQYEEYFTLTATQDLADILQQNYPNKTLSGVPVSIDSGKEHFALIISSADETTQLRINFSLWNFGVYFSPEKVVF